MIEPWQEAWEANKDSLAEVVHNAWMRTKLSHGFADHPFTRDPSGFGLAPRCDICGARNSNHHHTDMIPFADLSDEIKAYDYETALTVFPLAFEVGRTYEQKARP